MRFENTIIKIVAFAACISISASISAGQMASTNYAIKWDVTDSGGGRSTSTNYAVEGSMSQSTGSGESAGTKYIAVAGYQAVPDSDGDLIREIMDNCTQVANTDQRDTDTDGYGNICDPDFDNNLVINFTDLGDMKSRFFTADADADLDGNGTVNFTDLGILKSMFFQPPGPSGLVP